MRVVLAEKPSVAREIAAVLGANSRQDGYLEGAGHQVTWALGHLVTLQEPEDYDPALKRWALHTLPFVPDRFDLKLIDEPRAGKQFSIVKRLRVSAQGSFTLWMPCSAQPTRGTRARRKVLSWQLSR